jgi:hypothetical protein
MHKPTAAEIAAVEEWQATERFRETMEALMEEDTQPIQYRGIAVDDTWDKVHLIGLAEYLLVQKMTYDVGCVDEGAMRDLLSRGN